MIRWLLVSIVSNRLHCLWASFTVICLYLDLLYLAGGISETSPRAKLQIWQESVLSPIGSPWEFWTNRLHESESFFGACLFGRKQMFGFGTVQKCHKCEIYNLKILYLPGGIFKNVLRNLKIVIYKIDCTAKTHKINHLNNEIKNPLELRLAEGPYTCWAKAQPAWRSL